MYIQHDMDVFVVKGVACSPTLSFKTRLHSGARRQVNAANLGEPMLLDYAVVFLVYNVHAQAFACIQS